MSTVATSGSMQLYKVHPWFADAVIEIFERDSASLCGKGYSSEILSRSIFAFSERAVIWQLNWRGWLPVEWLYMVGNMLQEEYKRQT